MKLVPAQIDQEKYPADFRPLLSGAKVYDSSCSPEARVLFIDKEEGYFLKSAAPNTLQREAAMTKYFHSKGLSAEVIKYISQEQDWLLTAKIPGSDCTSEKYLSQPEKLCDLLAQRLRLLHSLDFTGCPVPNHTEIYLNRAVQNYHKGKYDQDLFPDNWGYKSAEEAWNQLEKYGSELETNTLLHGDYCLPNIIINNWTFSGFIDLDCSGIGDPHVDIFWGAWTLFFNLKTDKYRERFFDAYGRDKIDKDRLRVIAAAEVFG